MSATLTSAAIAERLARELIKALRKDSQNRYSLDTAWTLPTVITDRLPDYEDEYFLIRDSVVTVKPYNDDTCNGATGAPDKIWKWKPVIGALFHDPWCKRQEKIAKAWNWPVKRVRALGDHMFYGILARISPRWISRTYYHGASVFGGIYHKACSMLCFAIVVSLIGGCGGCTAPIDPFDPDQPLTIPDYTKTAQLTRPHFLAHRSPPT